VKTLKASILAEIIEIGTFTFHIAEEVFCHSVIVGITKSA
jgi:hypothetical protein